MHRHPNLLKYSLQNDSHCYFKYITFSFSCRTVSNYADMFVLKFLTKFSVKEFLGRYVTVTCEPVLNMIIFY
jgi:hypothetical protein